MHYLNTDVFKLVEWPENSIDGEDNDSQHYKPVWIWSAFPPPRCKDCARQDTRKRTPRRACSARLWAPTPLSSGTVLNHDYCHHDGDDVDPHIFKRWLFSSRRRWWGSWHLVEKTATTEPLWVEGKSNHPRVEVGWNFVATNNSTWLW